MNATPIDMLPELEDIEMARPMQGTVRGKDIKASRYTGASMLPPDQQDKFAKYIRGSHTVPGEAGMMSMSTEMGSPYGSPSQPQPQQPLQHPSQYPPYQQRPGGGFDMPDYPPIPYSQTIEDVDERNVSYTPQQSPSLYGFPTCLQCADHASSCPVCKSYFNNDKTMYIITIITLAVVCILLLKKVLEI